MSLLLPVLGSLACRLALADFTFPHLPLHTLLESLGGMMAVSLAGILLVEQNRRTDAQHFSWMAGALIGMGVLDLFHAAEMPSNSFIWLHVMATLVGGGLFALVWLPHQVRHDRLIRAFPLVVLIGAVAFGTYSCWPGVELPAMSNEAGQFTSLASGLNRGGGIAFLVAGLFFVRRFHRQFDPTDWLFAAHTVLFGSTSMLFELSMLWDAAWWWWHFLRLVAYLAAFVFGIHVFLDAEHSILALNRKLTDLNRTLDRTVELRTAELRASEERFTLAIRGSADGLWDWNIRTNEVYYAPRFKQLLGYTEQEFENVFASFESHLHPDDVTRTRLAIDHHLKLEEPYDVEYRLRTKSHEYRWFRARGQAVWDEGKAIRMAGSITDITQRKRAEESLEQYATLIERANESLRTTERELRKAVVERDQFLAMLSHELRNPLAALLNGVDVLEHADAAPELLAHARQAIRRQAQHMARLLDDLLDVARITQGKINFRKKVLDLNVLMAEAAQVVQPAVDSRRQRLSVSPASESVLVEGDPTRLLQVIENLLTNASKYTPPNGWIKLRLRKMRNDCELIVRDTGRGMDPSTLDDIFRMFYQSDNAIDRSNGGMGVGLTLVRALVEMHQGTIRAFSEGLGHGSRFVVRLPLTSKPLEAPKKEPLVAAQAVTRVLLVEDNPDSRNMLQKLLTLNGFHVDTAEDGQRGLDAILAKRPEVALIDIGLPELDGYEVARRVRQQLCSSEVRLVALTGYGQSQDRTAAFQAGFDEHLTKPVSPCDLARVLNRPTKPR